MFLGSPFLGAPFLGERREAPAAGVTMTIDSATHAHASDAVVLTQAGVLGAQDALHAHSVDGVTLIQAHALAVASASHAHAADTVALTQGYVLVPQDASHAHSADGVVFPGTVFRTSRLVVVKHEHRILVVMRND